MESRTPTAVSPLYLLERSDVGIVQLDPDRHVVGMSGSSGRTTGYTLVFYDITELVAGDEASAARGSSKPAEPPRHRRLLKAPTVSGQRIVLVDAADILCIRSDGHYTRVCTRSGSQFCNLAISDLESRLDPERFMRVHRSHIVTLNAVTQLLREDSRLALEVAGGGEAIPVSRSSAAAVLKRLGVAGASAGGARAAQG